MSSRFPERLAAAMFALAACAANAATLRVCADPDNLPYSDRAREGFENRIAAVVADELHAELAYEWQPLQRGFVRKTLGSGSCDVLIGVPAGFERVLTTRPYYRSSYAFVHRRGESIPGFDDPRLRAMRLGVQLVGNDLAATPPGLALAERGVTGNVTGFPVMGQRSAAQRMIEALASGRLDGCLVWGPQAGYFAQRASIPLEVTPLEAPPGMGPVAFQFAIAMGVRHGERELRDRLDAAIERRRGEIRAILEEYAVPLVAAHIQ